MGLGFPDGNLEALEIDLPRGALAELGVVLGAVALLIVEGVVLDRRSRVGVLLDAFGDRHGKDAKE